MPGTGPSWWVSGKKGSLAPWAQAKVWALTTVSEERGLNLTVDAIAKAVTKVGGGHVTQRAIAYPHEAMADDPDWPGDVEVKGPTLHTLQELAIAACASLGRRPSTLPRLGGPFRWELAEEHGGERDDWDSLRLGERCTVSEWLAAAGTRS